LIKKIIIERKKKKRQKMTRSPYKNSYKKKLGFKKLGVPPIGPKFSKL
jgi:hypothetical protein